MTLSVADIDRWNPEAVRDVFHAANVRAGVAMTAADGLASLPAFRSWGGEAADAAREAIGKTRVDLDEHGQEALAVAKAASIAADGIEDVKNKLAALRSEAEQLGFQVDPVSNTIVAGQGFHGTLRDMQVARAALQAQLAAIIAEANGVDAELAQAIDMASGQLPIPASPPLVPPPQTKPEDVKKWWESLTSEQKDRVLHDYPDQIGNLNGIPVAARDIANRDVMTADLDRLTSVAQRYGVSAEDVVRDPGKYGLSATDVTRYQNAQQTKSGLDFDAGRDTEHPRPTFLFAYDPTAFGGKGRAAICIGNPDTANNTAVIVPGTSASVKGGWLTDGHKDAINLYDQALKADPNQSTAVMAWMGYDAPNDFSDPRIARPWLARQGGASLASDVNGLWVTHLGQSHVTVLGHSYGSTTVADACANSGMHANDVVLLGSPGTDMAHSAADFHLDGGHVYVGAASTDPISLLGEPGPIATNMLNQELGYPLGTLAGLGPDPAGDGYGSICFHAEVPGSDGINQDHDHSHYYQMGSESLRAMTDIASGLADALGTDHLAAQGRHQAHLTTPGHVDIPGLGRVDIPHIDVRIPGTPAVIDPEWDRSPDSIHDEHEFQ